jgi:signal transduction histidine kinase
VLGQRLRRYVRPRIGLRFGLARYAALWVTLLALSAAVVLADRVAIAGPSPVLAAAAAALSGAVGLALLYLGTRRFLGGGRPLDLLAGAAFGTLALANLAVRVLTPALGQEPADPETGLWLLQFLRTLSTGLFLGGLVWGDALVDRSARSRLALGLGGAVGLAIGLGAAAILWAGDRLPRGIDQQARRLLEADAPILDVLPGQEPWLLLLNGALGLAMVAVSLGYTARTRRARDAYLEALAVALTLLAFGQLHTLLFPPVALDYISTAAAFRLAAYTVLLVSLVARVGRDIAEESAREERLRLSRELHDGLMQQLSLLNLRLGRAADRGRPAERRERDLEAARRVLEAAMLEARQATTALRSGAVSWPELQAALERFADDFGANHEVAIDLQAAPSGPTVGAALQADLLRIIHEACSNAIRHGAARRIEIGLTVGAGALELRIRDNGTGFDVAGAGGGPGVGLHSMVERAERRGGACSIDSAPGQGATVHASFPLPPTRGPRS